MISPTTPRARSAPAPRPRTRENRGAFGTYLIATLVPRHPRATLAALVDDPRGGRFASLTLATVAALYALVEWLLYRQHYDPVPGPFLRIPADRYYAWATLLCVPAVIGGWLLATGTMHLAARALGGEGSFDDLAIATAWATGVATLYTLVPDLIPSLFGVYATWDPTGHLWMVTSSLYLIAFVLLYSAAMRAIHRLPWRPAIAVGVGGFVLYQAFLFLFVR